MNKKGQYYPRPTYTAVSPIMIIGIVLFIMPFILPLMNINVSTVVESVIRIIGIGLIIVGASMSIYKASN